MKSQNEIATALDAKAKIVATIVPVTRQSVSITLNHAAKPIVKDKKTT